MIRDFLSLVFPYFCRHFRVKVKRTGEEGKEELRYDVETTMSVFDKWYSYRKDLTFEQLGYFFKDWLGLHTDMKIKFVYE